MALIAEEAKQIESLRKAGVIQPSVSPWASNPVWAQKKNGQWRIAIDYRDVNKQLITDAYPMPNIWEITQEAAGKGYLSKLDCQWGFWNVPISEKSRQCTAFTTASGLYEFLVLPFGIKNSPGGFQRAMDRIFGHLFKRGVAIYIDDIVIFTVTFDEHLILLREILMCAINNGVFLNVTKCTVLACRLELLGCVVSAEGIEPNPKKVEALLAGVAPTTKSELRSFLGMAGYMRRFIPYYAEVTYPLTQLLKLRAMWEWNAECQATFIVLKELLAERILLETLGEGQIAISCDASERGAGAALFEFNGDEDDIRLLELASIKFTSAQQKWDAREREAFAIRWAVERFHPYVFGRPTCVFTDHQSLKWMNNSQNGKVQRWSLWLAQYDLTIYHISGERNCIADWLSRSFGDVNRDNEIDQISVPTQWIACVTSSLSTNVLAPTVPDAKEFIDAYRTAPKEEMRLTVKEPDGLLYSSRSHRLYVPPDLRQCLLFWFHSSKYGGHRGVTATYRRMRRFCWWPRMVEDVRKYVSTCLACARTTLPHRRYLQEVLSRPVPFQLVSMDFVGPRVWRGFLVALSVFD